MITIVLPDIPVEDRLLQQARQGDQDAIRQIYEHYFPPIFQFIRLRVDDLQVAEDLAGNVFLKLVRACHNRKAPRHSLRGWLFRVARNELHDHYGDHRRLNETVLDEQLSMAHDDDPETQLMRQLDRRQTRLAFQQLTPEQQEVIFLRFGQAMNLDATADVMGKSVSAVKSLQFRAVNALRRIVQEMSADHD